MGAEPTPLAKAETAVIGLGDALEAAHECLQGESNDLTYWIEESGVAGNGADELRDIRDGLQNRADEVERALEEHYRYPDNGGEE